MESDAGAAAGAESASGASRSGERAELSLSSSPTPRRRLTLAAGGSASLRGPEVTSEGGDRRWNAGRSTVRVDEDGSGKVGRIGSMCGGSGTTL